MSTFYRFKNFFHQKLNIVKSNMYINKEDLYSLFFNKLSSIYFDETYLLNDNDFKIIQNFNLHYNYPFINDVLEMRGSIQTMVISSQLPTLKKVYQDRYNYFKRLEVVKVQDIKTTSHIESLEKDIINISESCVSLMFDIFECTRSMLELYCDIYVIQSYCEPQSNYRMLESLTSKHININEEIKIYIDNNTNYINDRYEKISNHFDTLQELVPLLISYYKELDSPHKINFIVN